MRTEWVKSLLILSLFSCGAKNPEKAEDSLEKGPDLLSKVERLYPSGELGAITVFRYGESGLSEILKYSSEDTTGEPESRWVYSYSGNDTDEVRKYKNGGHNSTKSYLYSEGRLDSVTGYYYSWRYIYGDDQLLDTVYQKQYLFGQGFVDFLRYNYIYGSLDRVIEKEVDRYYSGLIGGYLRDSLYKYTYSEEGYIIRDTLFVEKNPVSYSSYHY